MRSAAADGVGRSTPVRVLELLLLFLGVTAVAGGGAMTVGTGDVLPASWLQEIPLIDSWVVPGLVLLFGFGVGSLVTAYGVRRRPHWRWLGGLERITRHHWTETAALALGVGHVVWIGIEILYLPTLSWLQPLYASIGVAITALAVTPSVRRYLALPITVSHVLGAASGDSSSEERSGSSN